jgi:hypothetical protein
MLQAAVYPLALLWQLPLTDNPYYQNPQIFEWIVAAIRETLRRQHSNGSFDAFSPYEQDMGTTLGVIHGLAEAFRLTSPSLSRVLVGLFLESLERACSFASPRAENHAFVSNHRALFAVAFLDAYDLLGEQKYLIAAEKTIDSILANQSPDGWYQEYEGADPGYESLGIFHLATYWKRTRSARVLASLRRSIDFYGYCVHPDGSIGGVYGSRHTRLYFPGGFEILANEIPLAEAVAQFMSSQLYRNNVVTPATSDSENLPPLLYTYLEAGISAEEASSNETSSPPCLTLSGTRTFSDSGITVTGTPQYYAVIHAGRGGICCIFDRRTTKLVYQDSGYLVRSGDKLWTSQLAGLGRWEQTGPEGEIACRTRLARVIHELNTPARFILLRMLNLTLFRNPSLGNRIRRFIVRRMITTKQPGPIQLQRSITLRTDEIIFNDRLDLDAPMPVQEVLLPRSFSAIHMGSSKYFHPSELEATLQASLENFTTALSSTRTAERGYRLFFPAASGPILFQKDLGEGREAEWRMMA